MKATPIQIYNAWIQACRTKLIFGGCTLKERNEAILYVLGEIGLTATPREINSAINEFI